MTTTRLMPVDGSTVTAASPPPPAPSQRFYSATAGGFVDAAGDPFSGDAASMASVGWFILGTSGTTANRPPSPKVGLWHVDTTLGFAVVFDGANWRNPISGASV
jgi:hypothetical protein